MQVTITATGNGGLGYEELREATRQILDRARPERLRPALSPPLHTDAVRAMAAAYNAGNGKVTDEYLARLAVAYEELAPHLRDPAVRLAVALGQAPQTVKGHLVRARKEQFLTDTSEGQNGGTATSKAREVLGMLPNT